MGLELFLAMQRQYLPKLFSALSYIVRKNTLISKEYCKNKNNQVAKTDYSLRNLAVIDQLIVRPIALRPYLSVSLLTFVYKDVKNHKWKLL